MGKYKTFGSRFDRVHRNDLNANFAAVEADINAQKNRVDELITKAPQPSEVVDARGGFPVLSGRLNDLSSSLAQNTKQLEEKANLNNLVWNDTNADNTSVLNAAILLGKKIRLKDGTLTIKGRIRLDLAPNNSYDIEGCGESTILNFVGVSAGLYDKYGSQNNENYHQKNIGRLYLKGDGTNIGFEFRSLCLSAHNLVIDGFEKGLYLKQGGYGSTFHNVFVKRNKFGLYVDDLVTTVTFTDFYASVHNDPLGAAIYFNNYVEKIKIQGILQANKSSAIWFGTNFSGDVEFDCYFELNGDKTNNIKSVRNDSTKGRVSYKNSKIPFNQVDTWSTGEYQLGYDVLCENCRITTPINPSNSLSLKDCLLDGSGGILLNTPVSFSGFTKFGTLFGDSGANGYGIQLPAIVKQGVYNIANKHLNPFSDTTPSVSGTGTNQPTIALDTVEKFGKYNTTKITFADNIIGAAGNNCVYILGNSNQVGMNPDQLVICSFLIKGNQNGKVVLNITGTGSTPIFREIDVTTSWKKFLFIGENTLTGLNQGRGYLICRSALTNFVVNVTGVVVHEYVPNDMFLLNEILTGNLVY
jgi:hypothetical protein